MNYLELTNEALNSLNEVELTSATFSSSSLAPPQAAAKRAVNRALKKVYTRTLEWPFNYAEGTVTCVAGTYQYTLSSVAADLAHLDMGSFYIVKDVPDTTVVTKNLIDIDYVVWRDKFRQQDYEAGSTERSAPNFVYKTYDDKIGFTPVPDKAYSIKFDYWKKFVELSAYDDEPDVPDRYDHIILDGIMHYMYLYREDFQQARAALDDFKDGLKRMRLELIQQEKAMKRV